MRRRSHDLRPRGTFRVLPAIAMLVPVGTAALWLGATAIAGRGSVTDVSVSVSASAAGPVRVGDEVIFSVTVRNLGDFPAPSVGLRVALSGPVAGLGASADAACRTAPTITCGLGRLEGRTATTVAISAGGIGPGVVEADAGVTAPGAEGSPLNDRARARADLIGTACEVVGTAGPDMLQGTAGSVVCGLGGDDVLMGGPANDEFLGGGGTDLVSFADADRGVVASLRTGSARGRGHDRLVGIEGIIGSPFDDRLEGDAGPNELTGSGGDDVLSPRSGDDVLDGGPGTDAATFDGSARAVQADLQAGGAEGDGADRLQAIENVSGSRFDDRLTGTGRANELLGGAGDDILLGLGGDDVLDGGTGDDTASFAGSRSGVRADLSTGRSTGAGTDSLRSIEGLAGSNHDDLLTGSPGPNGLSGRNGADVLTGKDGDDDLAGGSGHDSLIGGPGVDSLVGGKGTDACAGGTGRTSKDRCEVTPIAEVSGVELFEPSDDVVGVGYHESMFGSAVAMRPEGSVATNDNPGKFSAPTTSDGPDYVVMDSRARGAAATSAIDIAVPSRSPVLSPVTGTVVLLRQYLLYCEAVDWQLAIAPDGRPDLRIMVLHTVDNPVAVGDRVVAGVTRIGTSWSNDLPSAQENAYFPDQYPHVHIEVEPGPDVPIPGCALE